MCDDNNQRAPIGGGAQAFHDIDLVARIERGGGLVRQDHRRLHRQHARQRDAAALARGQHEDLVARVVTEHPEAAQTLSQNGDDLKRQLQQNGTALLRLDIESSGQQRSGQQDQTGSATGSDSGSSAGSGEDGDADADGATSTDIPLQTLAGSALVNVLA